jgi:hypothetical protein
MLIIKKIIGQIMKKSQENWKNGKDLEKIS